MSRPWRIYIPGPGAIVLANLPQGGGAGKVAFLPVDANITSRPSDLFPAVSGGVEPTVNGDVNPDGPFVFRNFASTIDLYSTDNLSGITFQVTGSDIGGMPLVESLDGPNANVTFGTEKFARIDSIVASAPYSYLEITNGAVWRSSFIRADYDRSYWNATVQLFCDLSGETPFKVYATASAIPTGTFDPSSIPGTVIIDGETVPIPIEISWALQQQAFPITAVWMESLAASSGAVTAYFNMVLLQQGVKA